MGTGFRRRGLYTLDPTAIDTGAVARHLVYLLAEIKVRLPSKGQEEYLQGILGTDGSGGGGGPCCKAGGPSSSQKQPNAPTESAAFSVYSEETRLNQQ